jgi:hypothetical protein
MSDRPSRRPRTPSRRLVPRLEELDTRLVPCRVIYGQGLLGGTDFFANDLDIRAGRHREAVVVNDDGTGSGVTVLCNGATVWAGRQPVYGIRIDVGRANGVSVTYNLTGGLVGGVRALRVYMGDGRGDAFVANVNGNLVTDSNQAPGFLDILVQGGNGGALLAAHLRGKILGANSELGLDFRGGNGKNTLVFDTMPGADVGRFAQLDVSLDGGPRNDIIQAAYDGELRGLFSLDAQGEAGNDTLSADLNFEGTSDGTMLGTLPGGAGGLDGDRGNDRLSLAVHGTPGPKVRLAVDGGRGVNTCHVEGPVEQVLHCQRMV